MNNRVTLWNKIFWRMMHLGVFSWFVIPLTRGHARNHQTVPQEGPLLLLGNHATPMDPFWAAYFAWRRVHFMASAHLFRFPVIKTLLYWVGAFPKAKYTKDPQSMQKLIDLLHQGECVSLFPEGQRTFHGRSEPMLPGIGRLIKKSGVPVVFVRLLTAYHFHPRWARYPRSVNVELEYSEAVTFPPEMTDEQIQAEVDRRLYVDADQHSPSRFSFGWRLAHGLPEFVWACPECYALESLRVDPGDGDVVGCERCNRRWRLDVGNHLHPLTPQTTAMSVPVAHDRLVAHYGDAPCADPSRLEAEGVVIECPHVTLGKVGSSATPEHIAEGKGRLTSDRIQVLGDGDRILWEARLADLKAISLEVRSRLHLRTEEALFDFDPIGHSRYRWGWFIGAHRRARLEAEGKAVTGQTLSR